MWGRDLSPFDYYWKQERLQVKKKNYWRKVYRNRFFQKDEARNISTDGSCSNVNHFSDWADKWENGQKYVKLEFKLIVLNSWNHVTDVTESMWCHNFPGVILCRTTTTARTWTGSSTTSPWYIAPLGAVSFLLRWAFSDFSSLSLTNKRYHMTVFLDIS